MLLCSQPVIKLGPMKPSPSDVEAGMSAEDRARALALLVVIGLLRSMDNFPNHLVIKTPKILFVVVQ